VSTGQIQAFVATATRQDGTTLTPSVTWSATGGTISPAGVYTAGSSAGSYRVVATEQGSALADTSTVTVSAVPPTLLAINLSPVTASLFTGGTQQFAVSGQWSDGSTAAPAVTYSATGGTINAAGLYTGGGAAGTFRVVASQQGGSLADTATVTLTAPVLQAVVLSPSSVAIGTGATQQFSVAGQWSNGATTPPAVTYSATGGTITGAGLYTAGTAAGTFRVIATQQGGSLADTSVVTLSATPPVLQAVVLAPSSASVIAGTNRQFTVSGQWSDGSTTAPAVSYAATGGTITSGGLYTAGGTPGTFRVIAMQQGGTLADTAAVTVTAPVLQSLALTPATVTLQAGASQQFAVSGVWNNGATTTPAVTYSATGGTITTGGLYTAGGSAGTFRVIATQQGGTVSDTSAITISAPVLQAVVLTPSSASLMSGATRQFNVSGQWSDGATTAPAVTYAATGGTITSGGLYTAGSTAGSYRVIATQQGGTLADTSTVTITAPVLQAVILTPASASLSTGGTQQFSVSGQWSNGATTPPAVTYAATGGTITSGGLYTAGGTAGTFAVIATQQGGTLADTAVVSVTSPPAGGSYPNRPANFTTVISDLNLNQDVPAGSGERFVAGLGNTWSVIYDGDGSGGSNFSRATDATAPQSPSGVWRLHVPGGTYGTPGSGGGHSFGSLGRPLPNVQQVYVSVHVKWSNPYTNNPISTKWLRFEDGAGGNLLIQYSHNNDFLRASDESIGQAYEPQNGSRPTLGVWHQVEVLLMQGNPGTVRVWVDGQLRTNYTNLRVNTVPWNAFSLDAYFGGGGTAIPQDQDYWIDHVFIATR